MRWLAVTVCIAFFTALAVSQPQAFYQVKGCAQVLRFLAPNTHLVLELSDDARMTRSELLTWAAPGDWAQAYLASPECIEGLDQWLKARPCDSATRSRALTLVKDERLSAREISPGLLELQVLDPSEPRATLLLEGLVEVLQRKAQADQERLCLSPELTARVHTTLEALERCEARLARPVTLENPVPLNYALSHYQESLREWRQSKEGLAHWRDGVTACAPQFLTVAGTTVQYEPAWARLLPLAVLPIIALGWASRRLKR